MNVAEALRTRISTRAFLPDPVPESEIRRILDDARWSPSGGNLQPWHVIVVTGDARAAVTALARRTLAASPRGETGDDPIYPSDLQEPYRSRRFKIGEDMYALMDVPRTDKPARLRWVARNYDFFGAPVGLFFSIDRAMGRGQWAHLGMFMQSIALAAHEHGYGTCFQEAWAMVRDSLHRHFELPPHLYLYCGMALGKADPEAAVNRLRSDRAEIDEFTTLRGF